MRGPGPRGPGDRAALRRPACQSGRAGYRGVPRPHAGGQPRHRSDVVRCRAEGCRPRTRDRHVPVVPVRRDAEHGVADRAAVCHQRATRLRHPRHDHRHRRPVVRARRREAPRAGDRSVPGWPRPLGAGGDRHRPGPRFECLAHQRSRGDPCRRQGHRRTRARGRDLRRLGLSHAASARCAAERGHQFSAGRRAGHRVALHDGPDARPARRR